MCLESWLISGGRIQSIQFHTLIDFECVVVVPPSVMRLHVSPWYMHWCKYNTLEELSEWNFPWNCLTPKLKKRRRHPRIYFTDHLSLISRPQSSIKLFTPRPTTSLCKCTRESRYGLFLWSWHWSVIGYLTLLQQQQQKQINAASLQLKLMLVPWYIRI